MTVEYVSLSFIYIILHSCSSIFLFIFLLLVIHLFPLFGHLLFLIFVLYPVFLARFVIIFWEFIFLFYSYCYSYRQHNDTPLSLHVFIHFHSLFSFIPLFFFIISPFHPFLSMRHLFSSCLFLCLSFYLPYPPLRSFLFVSLPLHLIPSSCLIIARSIISHFIPAPLENQPFI